jgi:hypothetical protein
LLSGTLGTELLGVLDHIAGRQLNLRQYAAAEASYQETLRLLEAQTELGRESRETVKAGILHNLGVVAQEQQQWDQSRDFLLKGLAITVEFDDEYGLAITLRSLARLWQVSSDADLPGAIASIMHMTPGEVETLLSSLLSEEGGVQSPGPVL